MNKKATPIKDPIVKVDHFDTVTVLEMNSPPHNLVGPALMAGILDFLTDHPRSKIASQEKVAQPPSNF